MKICIFTAFVAIFAALSGVSSNDMPVQGSVMCEVCEFAMKEIKKGIENKKTEAEIANAVENVCKILPHALRKTCDHLIEKYGPSIIENLVNSVSPEKICSKIDLC